MREIASDARMKAGTMYIIFLQKWTYWLRAHARRAAAYRKTAVYQTNIRRDEAIIATFTGTVFLTGEELSEHLAGHIGMKS